MLSASVSVFIFSHFIVFGNAMTEPFDFGLMGDNIMDEIEEACRNGKVFSKDIRGRLMVNCVYPLVRESNIHFPKDFTPTLKNIVTRCWDHLGDFCRKSERMKANTCGVGIMAKKGLRYYNFYNDNKKRIKAAFNEKKDCILQDLVDKKP